MQKKTETGDGGRLLQIGDVADRVGLSLRTVRYWDEIGLVRPSARSQGGFRLYAEGDIDRLFLLKVMKPLGLTLEEMGELADLVESSESLAELAPGEVLGLVDRVGDYASRADVAIEKLGRQLNEAQQLRSRIGDCLSRCEKALAGVPRADGALARQS
jgi:DNA-binding transcriptional MerR regulator